MAGTLFTGGITITKEGQVLSNLNPQAGARAEEPGSQRSNGPANCHEQKGKKPGYLQEEVDSSHSCLDHRAAGCDLPH